MWNIKKKTVQIRLPALHTFKSHSEYDIKKTSIKFKDFLKNRMFILLTTLMSGVLFGVQIPTMTFFL